MLSLLQAELSGATIAVLQRLAALFSLSLMERQAGEVLEDGYLSGTQGSHCPESLGGREACCHAMHMQVLWHALRQTRHDCTSTPCRAALILEG